MKTAAVRVTYWAGRGRCEPLRCILAVAGVCVDHNFLTAETGKAELQQLRNEGAVHYDQVPMVEIDGLKLVQGEATACYLGRKFDLLPSDLAEAHTAQAAFAAAQDARSPMLGFPFSNYPESPGQAEVQRTLAACLGTRGLVGRYAPKWEAMINSSGGPYILGMKPTIGDVAIFEAVDYFKDVFGESQKAESFAPFPALLNLCDRVRSLGRLAEHCDVDRHKYATWDKDTKKHALWVNYATAVRQTLD